MTVIVIRHATPSRVPPRLPAHVGNHPVVCKDCSDVEEIRQCLCQIDAQPRDWVVLELGAVDEQQWCEQAAALGHALDQLPAQYIEVQATCELDLQSRLRLQHAPAAVVVDHRKAQGGYPLSLGIIRHRLAMED